MANAQVTANVVVQHGDEGEQYKPPECGAAFDDMSRHAVQRNPLRALIQRFRLPAQHVYFRADVDTASPLSVDSDRLPDIASDRVGLCGQDFPLGYDDQTVMTLCVNKVPTSCGLRQLVEHWTPDAALTLIHYPYNRRKQQRLGFCFVHFQSASSALAFSQQWHGRYLPLAKEPLRIVSAKVQGFANTLEYYRGWQLDDMEHAELLPAIFKDGQIVNAGFVLVALGIVEHPHAQLRGDPSMEAVFSL